MIDTDNLRTASLYINNQLLSRGLLRDGDSIDFAGTRRSDEEDAEVSGRIISVLNDLILRRDVSLDRQTTSRIGVLTTKPSVTLNTENLSRLQCAPCVRRI